MVNKINMQKISLYCLILFSFSSLAQRKLETTFLRNNDYVISFEKEISKTYDFKIVNLTLHKYVMGEKVDAVILKDTLVLYREFDNDKRIYTGDYYLDDPFVEMNFSYAINENKITEEEVSSYLNDLSLSMVNIDPIRIKRGNLSGEVQEFEVKEHFDLETNSIYSEETLILSRKKAFNEAMDREGNVYKTTKIGDQIWMAENLRAKLYQDSSEMPFLNEDQWKNSTSPGLLEDNPNGNYYNFYTLISDKNVCPVGFRIPDAGDVESLYNTITPYHEHLKVSSWSGKVKRRVYAPWLSPIVYPLGIAGHAVWWSLASGVDASAISLSALADIVQWTVKGSIAAVDAALISPFFGWTTRSKQRQQNLNRVNELINEHGYAVRKREVYDEEDWSMKIEYTPYGFPIDKEDWNNFIMVDSQGDTITDPKVLEELKQKHTNHSYKLKYSILSLPLYWSGSVTSWLFTESILFQDLFGLFGAISLTPYVEASSYDYENDNKYRFDNIDGVDYGAKLNYQPVISLLFNKKTSQFADEYGFNLNFDNKVNFPIKMKYYGLKYIDETHSTGITYNNFGYPGFFGLTPGLHDAHELNAILSRDILYDLDETEALRMRTRIRCVKED